MRSLRRTTALLALLVTAWSSLTAFPCGPEPSTDVHGADAHHRAVSGGALADSEGAHAHHAAPASTPSDGREPAPVGGVGASCEVLMMCGAAPRVEAVALVHTAPPPPLGEAPSASFEKPSAADRTQDPPPPRRHA